MDKRRSRLGKIAAALVALAAIVATGFGSGLGSWSAERLAGSLDGSSGRPISYSVAQLDENPCESGAAFLPDGAAQTVLEQPLPDPWSSLFKFPDAAFADSATVEVSIQGESRRTITLTGIRFDVTKRTEERPAGAVFRGWGCGGGAVARRIDVNLDTNPPSIIRSNASLDRLRLRPIRFPWTVSLTDPLLLYVNATTTECFCEWRGEIPWVSGSKRGTLVIDNEGEPFRLTDSSGLPTYAAVDDEWLDVQSDF